MAKSDFVTYVLDLLAPFGNVKARAMFGGYGIYLDTTIVGIVDDDVLYFKVDNTNREDYKKRQSTPFSYQSNGKKIEMSSGTRK